MPSKPYHITNEAGVNTSHKSVRLGLAETGHFYLSLRGAAGDVAISLALNSDS